MPDLTYEVARRLYDYDGVYLRWSNRITVDDHCRFKSMIGEKVGCANNRGYWRTSYKCRTYFVHRIIWLWVNGEWPKGQIDHVNRDPGDNRIDNLRVVTCAQNRWNRASPRKDIPVPGVRPEQNGKYGVFIGAHDNFKWLGTYDSAEEAVRARQAAEKIQRGDEFTTDYISALRNLPCGEEARERLSNGEKG